MQSMGVDQQPRAESSDWVNPFGPTTGPSSSLFDDELSPSPEKHPEKGLSFLPLIQTHSPTPSSQKGPKSDPGAGGLGLQEASMQVSIRIYVCIYVCILCASYKH